MNPPSTTASAQNANHWGGVRISKRDIFWSVTLALVWSLLVRAGPLSLPYFWDEADVYVPGSLWVAQNGLDIRPGVFPDDWSRGHPPLLYLAAGIAFRLFGPEPVTGHLLALTLAVLALCGTYLLGAALFGRNTGIAAAALLASTPLFLSIGAMLLPEIFLTGLTVLAFYCFLKGRMWMVALAGLALVLTKETGVFTCCSITGALFWESWRARALREKDTWTRLFISAIPLLGLVLFFIWQKALAGYFIFPHHQNMLWNRPFDLMDVFTIFPSTLLWNGRFWVVGAALFWVAWIFVRNKHKELSMQVPEAFTPGRPTSVGNVKWHPQPKTLVRGFIFLFVLNMLFFSKMFWLERYALPVHPGVLIVACGILLNKKWMPARRFGKVAIVSPLILGTIFGLANLNSNPGADQAEQTFAYADIIATHQQAFKLMEEKVTKDALILTSWPMSVELRHPYLGYVEHPHKSIHVDFMASQVGASVDFILLAQGSNHAQLLLEQARNLNFRLIGSFQIGHSPTLELYGP